MLEGAALTMVHCETEFLSIWIKHYEKMFGRKNLFIIAHGGLPEIIEMAEGCNVQVVPRKNVNTNHNIVRFALINSYINFMLSSYDFVVGGDVDEMVFVDPALGMDIFDMVEKYKDTAPSMKSFCLNVLGEKQPYDGSKLVFEQRNLARAKAAFCKPLVIMEPVNISVGFHTSSHPPFLPDGLYNAHLHYMCPDISKRIDLVRKGTLEQNPQIVSGRKWRGKWWGQGKAQSDQYRSNSANLEIKDFDTEMPRLTADLRSNEVVGPYKGFKTFEFSEDAKFRIRLPERFEKIL